MNGMNGIPILIGSGPPPHYVRPRQEERVPKRVEFAFNCLAFFSEKTETKIAGGGDVTAPQEFDGQKLDVEEKELFVASCKLLTGYVKGEYAPSVEEKEVKAERKSKRTRKRVSVVGACPGCNGQGYDGGQRCRICKGSKFVSIQPVRADGSPL